MSSNERAAFEAALNAPGFKGECGETALGDPKHVLLGLGKREELSADTLRTAAARLFKRLDRMAAKAVHLLVHDAIPARKLALDSPPRVAEGMALANWRFEDFAGKASKEQARASAAERVPATMRISTTALIMGLISPTRRTTRVVSPPRRPTSARRCGSPARRGNLRGKPTSNAPSSTTTLRGAAAWADWSTSVWVPPTSPAW